LRPIERKTTPFNSGLERLEFTVGVNETVNIGTISSALTSVPGALFERLLIDARKTYRLDDARTRDAVSKHNFPNCLRKTAHWRECAVNSQDRG